MQIGLMDIMQCMQVFRVMELLIDEYAIYDVHIIT